jgi:hypothetical protein
MMQSKRMFATYNAGGNDHEPIWQESEHEARSAATREVNDDGARVVYVFRLVATYRRNPQPAIEEHMPVAPK